MRNDQHQLPEDQIDLFEIAIRLWKGKMWILGAALLSIFAGTMFTVDQKPTITATIEVRPQLAPKLLQYQQLNNTGIVHLTRRFLLNQFVDELQFKKN